MEREYTDEETKAQVGQFIKDYGLEKYFNFDACDECKELMVPETPEDSVFFGLFGVCRKCFELKDGEI